MNRNKTNTATNSRVKIVKTILEVKSYQAQNDIDMILTLARKDYRLCDKN
jgi:hypothetical protein